MQTNKYSIGLSLLELLLATLLATMLLSLLIVSYDRQREYYRLLAAMIEVQEQATAAIGLLRRIVVHAGLSGCQHLSTDPVLQGNTQLGKLYDNDSLHIYANSAQYADVLSITGGSNVRVNESVRFKAGQRVLLSDCQHGQHAMIRGVHRQGDIQVVSLDHQLQLPYGVEAQLSHYQHTVFSVQKTSDNNYALYSKKNYSPKQALVAGIDALVIRYGVLSEQSLSFYSAHQILDWSAVRMLRVGLLVTSSQVVNSRKEKRLCLFDRCWIDKEKHWREVWYADMVLSNVS